MICSSDIVGIVGYGFICAPPPPPYRLAPVAQSLFLWPIFFALLSMLIMLWLLSLLTLLSLLSLFKLVAIFVALVFFFLIFF